MRALAILGTNFHIFFQNENYFQKNIEKLEIFWINFQTVKILEKFKELIISAKKKSWKNERRKSSTKFFLKQKIL